MVWSIFTEVNISKSVLISCPLSSGHEVIQISDFSRQWKHIILSSKILMKISFYWACVQLKLKLAVYLQSRFVITIYNIIMSEGSCTCACPFPLCPLLTLSGFFLSFIVLVIKIMPNIETYICKKSTLLWVTVFVVFILAI